MKALATCLVFGWSIIACCAQGTAADLELTIRPHSREVLFGDPLYIEVKIINRGKEAISAEPDYYHGDRFRFEIRDNDRDTIIWNLDASGERSPDKFDAGQTILFHQYVFAPGLRGFNHPFWKPIRGGQTLAICGVYRLDDRGTELRSHWSDFHVAPRDETECVALHHWATAELQAEKKGPSPGSFGLQFRLPLNRPQMGEIAKAVKTGEIADLFQLTIRMQELYALPREDDRGPAIRALVAWLEQHPDVKRQALTRATLSVAENNNEGNNMATAIKALRALRDRE